MNTATTFPVRTGAPRLDRRGRVAVVTPWLGRLGPQEPPANRAEQARLLWLVAQAQAADLAELQAACTAEFGQVQRPLLERQAQLQGCREALTTARRLAAAPSPAEERQREQAAAQVGACEAALHAAETECAQRLAEAGLRDRAGFDLTPDDEVRLGLQAGAPHRVPAARVWSVTTLLSALLLGPALYELGLRAAWLGLGLPEHLDALGVGLACVIGVSVAWLIKSLLEQVAGLAASRSGARHGLIAAQPDRLPAFLGRRLAGGLLVLVALTALFAYIEGTLVASTLAAGDVSARVGGGKPSSLLRVLSGLVALLPSGLWGAVSGWRAARVAAGEQLRAQARAAALTELRSRPDVRRAMAAAQQVDVCAAALTRAVAHAGAVEARAPRRQEQEEQLIREELAEVDRHLAHLGGELRALDGEYGRRLEQLHQRADQSAALALAAFGRAAARRRFRWPWSRRPQLGPA